MFTFNIFNKNRNLIYKEHSKDYFDGYWYKSKYHENGIINWFKTSMWKTIIKI